MSRIGNAPISLPSGVTIEVSNDNTVMAKGPRGELSQKVDPDFKFEINEGEVVVVRPSEQKRHKALHGLYRSLINNIVVGVSSGYKKELELIGVGYKLDNTGNLLEIQGTATQFILWFQVR